jgi:hypothetical protein
MKLEMAIAPTRLVAMCLGPEAGGTFDIREVPRRSQDRPTDRGDESALR